MQAVAMAAEEPQVTVQLVVVTPLHCGENISQQQFKLPPHYEAEVEQAVRAAQAELSALVVRAAKEREAAIREMVGAAELRLDQSLPPGHPHLGPDTDGCGEHCRRDACGEPQQ